MAVAELQRIAGADMVSRPGLIAVAFPADSATNEEALVRIQIVIETIPIIKLADRRERLAGWSPYLRSIRVSSLKAQIQFRQFRKPRQINTRRKRASRKVREGGYIVGG